MRTPGSVQDRRAQRRQVRLDIRRLPPPLRRLLRPITNPMIAQAVLATIEDDLAALTGSSPLELHPADRQRLVEHLATQHSYVQRIRNLTHAERRRCHLDWVRRSDREQQPVLRRVTIPDQDTWCVSEDLGLGTASFLEAMPEEVAAGIAQELHRWADSRLTPEDLVDVLGLGESVSQFQTLGEDEDGVIDLSVLVIGAGPRTLAHALDAVGDSLIRAHVIEVDSIDSERDTICVEARYRYLDDLLLSQTRFDVVVMHLPCPARDGAKHHRSIYYDLEVPYDPARLGPKEWSSWASIILQSLPALLAEYGVAHIYAPMGLRTRRGYVPEPHLADAVKAALNGCGLTIFRDVLVIPDGSVAQPFVGRARCSWRLLSVRHEESGDE